MFLKIAVTVLLAVVLFLGYIIVRLIWGTRLHN